MPRKFYLSIPLISGGITGDIAAAFNFAKIASELEPGNIDFHNRVMALQARLAAL
jgi:hypothetical protein